MSYSVKDRPLSHWPKKYSASAKEGLIHHYWWVILFIAICFGIYAHAAHKKRQAILALESYLNQLNCEKQNLIQDREELLLNIHSQSDPAWVELALMKGLGLVPEGKVKVYFDSDCGNHP